MLRDSSRPLVVMLTMRPKPEPRGLYRERNGWAETEHSARVKYDEHQELDISERLYRARDYQPPFDELPWLD